MFYRYDSAVIVCMLASLLAMRSILSVRWRTFKWHAADTCSNIADLTRAFKLGCLRGLAATWRRHSAGAIYWGHGCD